MPPTLSCAQLPATSASVEFSISMRAEIPGGAAIGRRAANLDVVDEREIELGVESIGAFVQAHHAAGLHRRQRGLHVGMVGGHVAGGGRHDQVAADKRLVVTARRKQQNQSKSFHAHSTYLASVRTIVPKCQFARKCAQSLLK